MTGSTAKDRAAAVARAIAVTAVVLSGAYFLRAVTAGPATTFDDSYMFLRYARHLLAGLGLAWNPDGVPTYGATSLLHVAVVAALRALTPLDDPAVLRVASVGAGVAAAALLVLIARRFTTAPALRGFAVPCGLVLPPLLASNVFVFHCRTGMDTMLAVLTNAALVLAALRMAEHPTRGRALVAVAAAWLAVQARPDAVVYAVAVPAAAAWLLAPRPDRGRLLVTVLAGLAVVLAADAAWKAAWLGSALPLPLAAKSAGHYGEYAGLALWNPVEYLLTFTRVSLPFLVVLVAFASRRDATVLATLLAPVAATFAASFLGVQIMGYQARFYVPSLPFVVVAAWIVLDRRLAAAAPIRAPAVAARALAVVALLALFPLAEQELPDRYARAFLRSQRPAAADAEEAGGLPELQYWTATRAMGDIARRSPEGTVLCMTEYGYVGAVAPDRTIVDPLGLHDAEFARKGFSAARLLERRPDLIWLPHPNYVGMRRDLLRSAEFRSAYDHYPGAFGFGIALRRDSPRAAELRDVVRKVWEHVYPGAPMEEHRAP